jgi:hypothetical protein
LISYATVIFVYSVDLSHPDCCTRARHLKTQTIFEFMPLASIQNLSDPHLAPHQTVDAQGRSAQTFLVEAVARSDIQERRAVARGQDICAVTAPLVVQALLRILEQPQNGVAS